MKLGIIRFAFAVSRLNSSEASLFHPENCPKDGGNLSEGMAGGRNRTCEQRAEEAITENRCMFIFFAHRRDDA